MSKTETRKIVHIDEEKCNGCGECIPSCAEGAIQIIHGKAKLVGEVYCDGMGACLGHCPQGAISIEERPAAAFDPNAVERWKQKLEELRGAASPIKAPAAAGCPGLREIRVLRESGPEAPSPGGAAGHLSRGGSRLGHWPVQLALVPAVGRIWQDADVLIAADCVPFAMADFHEKLLGGKSLAIACPKLDDMEPHLKKLAAIFAENEIRSVTVAHIEVPCCLGILRAVKMALALTGKTAIPVKDITVGVRGEVI